MLHSHVPNKLCPNLRRRNPVLPLAFGHLKSGTKQRSWKVCNMQNTHRFLTTQHWNKIPSMNTIPGFPVRDSCCCPSSQWTAPHLLVLLTVVVTRHCRKSQSHSSGYWWDHPDCAQRRSKGQIPGFISVSKLEVFCPSLNSKLALKHLVLINEEIFSLLWLNDLK